MGTQLVLVLVVALWTMANGWLLFGALYKLRILRIAEQMERTGIDKAEHGGSAVNMRRSYPKGKGSEDASLLQNAASPKTAANVTSSVLNAEKVKSMSDADEIEEVTPKGTALASHESTTL